MKIGLFGGTFDPVHCSHLTIAKKALFQFDLNHIYWLPTKISPFKLNTIPTQTQHRLNMLHLALKNSPNMSVLDWEIKRPSPSYTLDTVIQAENTWPNTTLYWIMGSDQLPELQNWHEIELLKSKIIFLIYERLPYLINDYPFEGDYYPITGLALPEAATTIRNNIKNNNIDRLNLNKNVLNYIKKNQLYLK